MSTRRNLHFSHFGLRAEAVELSLRTRVPYACTGIERSTARRSSKGRGRTAARSLITRNGHDCASRYPLIVAAVDALWAPSCIIDPASR